MRTLFATLLVLVIVAAGVSEAKAVPKSVIDRTKLIDNNWNILVKGGENGGGDCAGCTIIVGLLEQYAQLENSTIDKAIEHLCEKIPGKFGTACAQFFKTFGPAIIKLIEDEATADEVCHVVKLCKDETATCRLFPPSHLKKHPGAFAHLAWDNAAAILQSKQKIKRLEEKYASVIPDLRSFNICTILPEVCLVEDHLPAFDADGDRFSATHTLRGDYWRGKDCNDNDNKVHPGLASADATVDQNCNGIFGTDNATGIPWETKLCNGTDAMGIGVLGDSATAHFRIPPGWVTAEDWLRRPDNFGGVVRDAEDELDWPMLSWSTGHLNTSEFSPDIWGPTDSLYLQLRKKNLCNNNDYQNLGVNGAKSTNLKDFAELLARVNDGDSRPKKPMMLYMAMIGNDVCGGHHGFSTMTSVEIYHAAVKEAVLYADSILPPGSVIGLVGLADGRVLYEYMHDRIHPLGSTNQDVTYKDVYNFLNCLYISPCWGWMNDNATVRNMTTAHANLLSAELPKVVSETSGQLVNSRIFSIVDWISAISDAPYPKWELIEPVDGFHPSQLGNFLLAQYFYNKTRDAGMLPAENPNNGEIAELFNLNIWT